jgi:hypothetical protein
MYLLGFDSEQVWELRVNARKMLGNPSFSWVMVSAL